MTSKPVTVGYNQLKHVFDVLSLDTSTLNDMYDQGIRDPKGFVSAFSDMDDLRDTCADDLHLSKFECKSIGRVWLLLSNYYAKEKSMPQTLDDFKKIFNKEIYDDFVLREVTARTPTPRTKPKLTVSTVQANTPVSTPMTTGRTTTTTTGTTNFKISLSDFPTFDGNQSNWLPFKKEVISVMALMQRSDLTQQKSEQELLAHDQLMSTDQAYSQHVIDLHAILMKKTAKGLAASMVDAHRLGRSCVPQP